MMNNTSAIICAKGDKQLSAISCSNQVDVEKPILVATSSL
jgi:hypothetical protein